MYLIKSLSKTLTLLTVPFILVACGGGSSSGGGSDTQKQQNLNLTKDTAFVYVERNISNLEQGMNASKLNKTNQNVSLLALGSPYDFNPGAKLVSRSSLDTSAIDTELLTQYFGSANFDVKDVNMSADGAKAIFAAHGPANHSRDYTWNIYEYTFASKSIHRVIASDWVANAGEDTNPTYALDGSIIFSSNRAAGNPESAVDNIVDPDQANYCHKVDAGDNASLLHSMTVEGGNILQLTYGKNHDIKPTTLKDGRIAFVRWSHTEDLVEGCPVNTIQLEKTGAEVSDMPTGLDAPHKWSQDKLCSMAILTDKGYVLPTNHYTLLTITPDGKDMDQLYKEVTVAGSDEGFIEVDQIIQVENGQLVALLKHHYNSLVGGDIVELQSPEKTLNQQVFGNISPESLVGDVALYPNQHSVDGWYSAFWPYRDGSGRLLVSWSQCATTKGSLSQLCQSSNEEGTVEGRYGIWVFDQKSGSRLPIVLARKDVVYSNIAVAQPHLGLNFPFEPFKANYIDNLDSNHVACDYPKSSSSYSSYNSYSYSSYSSSSYSSSSYTSSYSASSHIYVPSSTSSMSYASVAPSSSSSYASVVPSSSSSYASVAPSSSSSDASVAPSSSSVSLSSVSSSLMMSSSSSSSVPTNTRPVANAGLDQMGNIGTMVTLDGSASTDADGDALTYQWTLIGMDDDSVLTDATSAMAGLTPAQHITYTIQLVVSDGNLSSEPDTVQITVDNIAPVANAGVDQSAILNNPVKLDGTASTDADGDELSYSWKIVTAPEGSQAVLVDAQSTHVSITPDVPGSYTLALVVNDGYVDSSSDTVIVNTLNIKPVANAGSDQAVKVSDTTLLNGGASTDADGDDLSYSWSLLSKPEGSTAVLTNDKQVLSQIEIDKAGSYTLQLIVNDGTEASEPDTVVVTTQNTRPIAEAGKVQTVYVGDEVKLDGSASYDPDGDAITYAWNFTSKPTGTASVLQDTMSNHPSFTTDKVGSYVVQLRVSDGSLDHADTVTINVEQPVCNMDSSTKRTVPVTIRDFDVSHPDFEYVIANDLGIVTDTLGTDGLPVYANNHGKSTTNKANFDQWYRDVSGTNIKFQKTIEMTRKQNSSVWSYTNTSFFPIDGEGFGNYKNYGHNYHFTMESHLVFDYVGGEVFTFKGDDDLWIYINGKLAIDIGGVHDVTEKSVDLDKAAAKLGIEKGKTYSFDLFFAERHTTKSNFMFQTNINLECLPR